MAQPGGPSYFHNPTTGEVTWTAPPAVLAARGAPTPDARQDQVGDQVGDRVEVKRAEPVEEPVEEPAPATVPIADEDEDIDFDPDAYEAFDAPPSEPEPAERMVRVGDYLVPASALAPERDDGGASAAGTAPALTPRARAPVHDSRTRRVGAFDELLREKGVDEKTRWDRAVHKMSSDARFLAVPTHAERRRLFERFGRRVADEKRRAKTAQRHLWTAPGRHPLTVTSAPSLDGRWSVVVAKIARSARGRRRRGVSRACVARRTETPSSENFRALLAETIRSAEMTWEEANARMATDAAGRGRWEDIVSERDARDLFRRRVEELTSRAEDDARGRLEATIVAVSAEDFAPNVRGGTRGDAGSDEEDEPTDANPRNSFVAAAATEGLAGDPRWERCPLERRAALYVAHIERLCAGVGVDVPEDVAALGDELARESEAKRERAETKKDGIGARGKTRARSGDAMILLFLRDSFRRVMMVRKTTPLTRPPPAGTGSGDPATRGRNLGVGSAPRVNPVELVGCFPTGHMTVLWLAAPRQRVVVARPSGGPAREGWRSPPHCPGIFARWSSLVVT